MAETGLSRHIDAEVGSLEDNARERAHKNGIEAESSAKRTEADEGSLFSGFGRNKQSETQSRVAGESTVNQNILI